MAFGGGAGIPAGMFTAANIGIPYGNGVGSYDLSNRVVPAAAGAVGSPYVGDPAGLLKTQVRTLDFFMASGEFIGQQAVPLSAFADQTVDGSAVDTGILVTGTPAANQHGIPTNFGPGRGNWVLADLVRLTIDVLYARPAAFAANLARPAVAVVTLSGGNVTIVFKNQANQDLSTLGLRLHYNHSLEM